MITQQDLQSLVNAASLAGCKVAIDDFKLSNESAAISNHKPLKLTKDFAAVYIFTWNNSVLKVGKVNYKSNARYLYQHYNPGSSRSNLARSLLNDPEFSTIIGGSKTGDWIKKNTTRYNIIISNELGKYFVNFTEAFFILKYKPKFENTRV